MAGDTVAPDKEKDPAGSPRFEEQCYLLWNWPTFQKNNLSQTYENFTILMGEPSSIINRLMSKKGIERLFELKPYQIALLVPKIRIFKSGPDGADQELIFSDHTSPESIENIMKSGFGRGDGIGIKSFDYDLQGGSARGGPALVKKGMTKINFKFLFQNLEMLVQRQEGHPALIDLVSLPNVKTKDVPTCSDTGEGVNISRLWDAKKFQMKVVYGWAVPHGSFLGAEMKAAIQGSATTLLVNYEKHDLDFKQDGSVELAVTSNGFADTVLADPQSDILWLDEKRAKHQAMKKAEVDDATTLVDETKKELSDAQKEEKAEEDAGEDSSWLNVLPGSGPFLDTDAENKVDDAEDKVEDKEDAAEEAAKAYNKTVAEDKIYVYSRMTNALNNSGRIFFVDLTPAQVTAYEEDVKAFLAKTTPKTSTSAGPPETSDAAGPEASEGSLANSTPSEQEAVESETAAANESPQPDLKPQTANAEDTPIAENNEAVEAALTDSLTFWPPQDGQKALEEHSKENLSTTKIEPPNKRLFYLYYGDLLDVAFVVLKQNPAAENIRAMMGPVAFTDAKTGTKTIINLADVAISLNKFLEWWNRNVVGKQRSEYMLADFVRDTIKDLVHAALGEGCWEGGGGAPTPPPTVAMQPLIVPGTGPDGNEDRIPKGGRLNIEDISSVSIKELVPGAENRESTGLHIYIYIYSYAWSSKELQGNQADDHEKGIYHLSIGGDRGLVKSMKFSKSGVPKLDASRATKQGCDLRHLQQQYKVTVEMIGNSIFKPGQFVYINPSTMGGGDPQTRRIITEKLGLGGYYTINKVNGDITSAGFRTTIEAFRQAGSKSSDPASMAPTDGAKMAEPAVDAMPQGKE